MSGRFDADEWVISILRTLALGRDPHTKQMVAADHVLHRPEVIRALMIAAQHLEGVGILKPNPDKPLRAGESSTDSEERELREMYDRGRSMSEIANSLQRTRGSIRSRLLKLEVIDDFQEALDENRETRSGSNQTN